jgi:hypothetical protein
VTAREIGRVTIAEALGLTALVARKQPERYGRFAARWLCLLFGARDSKEGRTAELTALARNGSQREPGARLQRERALGQGGAHGVA